MTDKEIHERGYWLHVLTLAEHNNFGFEILKKLKKSWRSELNKFDFETPEAAREEGEKQLRFLLNL